MVKRDGFWFCFDDTRCKTCKALCCIGEGYVFLTNEDIERISEFLGLKREDFLKTYTRKVFGKIALIDLVIKGEKRCVFLDDNYRCEIYPVRPKQCESFPFWEKFKELSLNKLKKLCPAIEECR
ncbi:YkgJ family cysteine cluster protein [Hippea alviniae]|uniref:YkgJ family cysteine cluster protein n=1 Tax=Hippea alviniae TaxID=1279027 RepID=UPI0003B70735|nr:YkgJ family cysteine cluster protein [Hippea alviniae]